MGRFARSVWKTEQLWVPLVELFLPVYGTLRSLGLENRATMSSVGGVVLACLWGASLARFGKPSDYGSVGGVVLACLWGASLGLENRATMGPLVECSCLFMGRFARSVWKTERLWGTLFRAAGFVLQSYASNPAFNLPAYLTRTSRINA